MSSEHKFLRHILPARVFEAVKTGTKQWLIECKCGHLRDLWDEGGIRYKAVGEHRQYLKCPECRQKTWHKIRLKTDSEKNQI